MDERKRISRNGLLEILDFLATSTIAKGTFVVAFDAHDTYSGYSLAINTQTTVGAHLLLNLTYGTFSDVNDSNWLYLHELRVVLIFV